jgi:cardiolipin synthase A/B
VTLINSEAVDQMFVAHAQRSYYEGMLRAGMKIYLYRAPTLLHSKYIVIDDDFVLIGSSNMDVRSFKLNHELTVVFHDKKLVLKVWEITRNYILRSVPVDKEAWLARPSRKQLLDNIARLTSGIQ